MYEYQSQNQTDDEASNHNDGSVVCDCLRWRQVQLGSSVGLRLLNYVAHQDHWSERGRATSVANADARGRLRR
ncbi:MAG: hypothetical protein WC740_24825 [Verrucomicrobiia bacterium]